MNIIIVEDEQHNSRLLKGMIEKIRPQWNITGIFESVKSSVAWLKENMAPDLIFMDIQLTDGICFSIFEQVEVSSQVIFTTAYDEYAIQAFKVNSIDYLLKPVKEEGLVNAIEKFENLYQQIDGNDEKVDYRDILEAIKNGEKKYRKRFLITGTTSYFKIEVKDIAYFYTENRVTFAVTFNAKEHLISITLEKLEEQLDPDIFFRANRSIIINNETVEKVENYFGGKLIIKMIPPFKNSVTVSRMKATAFKDWLDS